MKDMISKFIRFQKVHNRSVEKWLRRLAIGLAVLLGLFCAYFVVFVLLVVKIIRNVW